jgi:hypothetical protein
MSPDLASDTNVFTAPEGPKEPTRTIVKALSVAIVPVGVIEPALNTDDLLTARPDDVSVPDLNRFASLIGVPLEVSVPPANLDVNR